MKILRIILITGAIMAFIAVNLILFTVDTTEYAIVTQFGNPVQAITQPGLYWKFPDPIQTVQPINNQLQIYNLPQTELLTQDKKNIVIEAYATWRVTDPLQFLKAVGDTRGAETRLTDILASEMGVALGQVPLNQLVTVEAEAMQLPETLTEVTQATDAGPVNMASPSPMCVCACSLSPRPIRPVFSSVCGLNGRLLPANSVLRGWSREPSFGLMSILKKPSYWPKRNKAPRSLVARPMPRRFSSTPKPLARILNFTASSAPWSLIKPSPIKTPP